MFQQSQDPNKLIVLMNIKILKVSITITLSVVTYYRQGGLNLPVLHYFIPVKDLIEIVL